MLCPWPVIPQTHGIVPMLKAMGGNRSGKKSKCLAFPNLADLWSLLQCSSLLQPEFLKEIRSAFPMQSPWWKWWAWFHHGGKQRLILPPILCKIEIFPSVTFIFRGTVVSHSYWNFWSVSLCAELLKFPVLSAHENTCEFSVLSHACLLNAPRDSDLIA